MRNENAQPYNNGNRNNDDRSSIDPARDRKDIHDDPRDEEKLKGDEATLDLPDVKDIPGQEFVQVPPLGMMADTTASSADEEGEGLFEDDEEDETDIVMGTSADISREERQTLERGEEFMPTHDEENLQRAALDNTDMDGDPLNERGFGEVRTATDLDTATTRGETNRDALGQGDEENKSYSLGSDKNDDNENRAGV